jgi:hypothetical protein
LLDDSILADPRWPGDDKNPRTAQRPQVTDEVVGILAEMIARDRLHARDLSIWSRVRSSFTRLKLDDGATFRPGLRHALPLSGPRGPIRERLFCARSL